MTVKCTDRLSVESSTSPRFIDVIKLTHSVLMASLMKLVASLQCCRFGSDSECALDIDTPTD